MRYITVKRLSFVFLVLFLCLLFTGQTASNLQARNIVGAWDYTFTGSRQDIPVELNSYHGIKLYISSPHYHSFRSLSTGTDFTPLYGQLTLSLARGATRSSGMMIYGGIGLENQEAAGDNFQTLSKIISRPFEMGLQFTFYALLSALVGEEGIPGDLDLEYGLLENFFFLEVSGMYNRLQIGLEDGQVKSSDIYSMGPKAGYRILTDLIFIETDVSYQVSSKNNFFTGGISLGINF